MKETAALELIKANEVLNERLHMPLFEKLKDLSLKNGIISICIESNDVFIEFNPVIWALSDIKEELEMIGFPFKNK